METIYLSIQTPAQLSEIERALSERVDTLKGEIVSNRANVNPQLNVVPDMLNQVRAVRKAVA